jgi:hypothetical protein
MYSRYDAAKILKPRMKEGGGSPDTVELGFSFDFSKLQNRYRPASPRLRFCSFGETIGVLE